ncbi:MAG: WXG100 family type VII secretion target [Sedimentisphaerales bacterium]|nr:WXG100 family type VII secretion target [Sedimentisphaerales bacterium]
MAKVNVDPGEVRRFARELKRFNGELESLTHGLRMRMLTLEKTWDDQEQRKFKEEFDQSMKTLTRFMDMSSRHVSFLMKKARLLEDYLQQG